MSSNSTDKKSFMRYGPPLIPGILAITVFIIIKIMISVNRTNMVINLGIKGYRTMNTAMTILLAISIVATIVILLLKLGKMKTEMAKAQQARSERPEAVLSTHKEMNADNIRMLLINALEQHTHKVPNGIYKRISTCAELMDDMDKYQKKLSNLLNNNGADGFSDTEEVLDQVEQCICKNVRKVVNYISVADCGNEEDVETIKEKLDTCIADTQNQLSQVKEFLFAMAEFLNKQGDEDTTSEKLEIYKDLILKSINDEDDI